MVLNTDGEGHAYHHVVLTLGPCHYLSSKVNLNKIPHSLWRMPFQHVSTQPTIPAIGLRFMSRPPCHDYQSEWVMGSQADKTFVSQGGELSVKALCKGEWSTLKCLSEAFSLRSEARGSEGIERRERKEGIIHLVKSEQGTITRSYPSLPWKCQRMPWGRYP